MRIRTKLVLVLTAVLVVTTVASAALRLVLLRDRLETRAKAQARETATDIAADLERQIKDDWDDDDIAERLKFALRRHPSVANIEFSFDSDEETTVNFHLDFAAEEAQVKRTPRPARKAKAQAVVRHENRRALYDHGDSLRRPGERTVEPMWRTPDRPESSRWAVLAPRPAPPPKASRPLLVDLRSEAERQGQRRYLDLTAAVDPEGPRRGQLKARVSLEAIDSLIRQDQTVTAVASSSTLLLLVLLAALIADRIVGRPVGELTLAMRRVGEGDLSRRVAARGSDEIGALSRGFNAMIHRLGQADDEIRAFNRRLAEEVQAATADLARKNEVLDRLNRLLLETRRELGDKERLAVLGQLAAQLAHEIGTPLASVSGHLQLALIARDLPAPLKDRLVVASKEIERISKIVRDYLDSTRPVKPARVDCDLPRVIDEAVGIAGGAAQRPELRLEAIVDPAAPRIATDAGLLRQILINLLTNAIDASGGKGQVTVRTIAAVDSVAISVRDEGVGIAPEDAARIFEPFYTTKGRGKGTGLGLAICRELTTALGGQLAVESAPGAGSTFTIRLPRDERRPRAGAGASS